MSTPNYNWFEIEYYTPARGKATGYTTSPKEAQEALAKNDPREVKWDLHSFKVEGGTEKLRGYIVHVDGGWVKTGEDWITTGCKYNDIREIDSTV
jgi:hypothetical protein